MSFLRRPRWAALGAALFLSCAQPPAKEKETPTPEAEAAYRAAAERLVTGFLENGWVVSRKPDGSPQHVGEGLIWSGIALAALPCDLGDQIETMLVDMIQRQAGGLVRYEPLGEYAGGREVTLDGALGLYRGIAERVTRCGKAEVWAPIVRMHLMFLDAHNWRLHENVDAKLMEHFDTILQLLAYRLGVGSAPHTDSLRALLGEITAWAAGVNATKAAAYRVNLGMIAFETLETLDWNVPDEQRWQFCAATRGIDIPTVDHWCSRRGIFGWIDSYQYNVFEYRHQRSGSWESPDADGDQTPGLDLLVAYRMAYDLSN